MMIILDGAHGEGGGQILRSALALSLISQQAFTLTHIRAKRPKPGLMRQHLACVQAAAMVSGQTLADIEGAYLGSEQLVFKPKPVSAGEYTLDIGSAGSTMLVLQTVLWPLLLAADPSTLCLKGGTHNPFAPNAHDLALCLPPLLAHIGGGIDLNVQRHGFYPAGGGVVEVVLTPTTHFKPFELMERGSKLSHAAHCIHAGIPRHVVDRELSTLAKQLNWGIDTVHDRGLRANEGPGNALMAVVHYEHIAQSFCRYGAKGVSAEQVAMDLAKQVQTYQAQPAPVGEHWADQLMLPLALAGQGRYYAQTLSPHMQSNALVIESFLPCTFVFTPQSQGGVIVEIVKKP